MSNSNKLEKLIEKEKSIRKELSEVTRAVNELNMPNKLSLYSNIFKVLTDKGFGEKTAIKEGFNLTNTRYKQLNNIVVFNCPDTCGKIDIHVLVDSKVFDKYYTITIKTNKYKQGIMMSPFHNDITEEEVTGIIAIFERTIEALI